MQEYLRRDSLLPVLRLLFDLAFLGAAIVGACAFEAWWAKGLMVVPAVHRHRAAVRHRPRRLSWQLHEVRLAQQGRRPHRLPAFADAVLALGRGPQRRASRLHEPQGSRPGLGAAVGRRVGRRFQDAPRARTHLSLRFRPGPLLHDRNVVEEAHPAQQEACRRASRHLHLGQRAGAERGRRVDHRAGALGGVRQPFRHLDAALRLRAAVPGVQLHHWLGHLRAAHAPGSGLVRQARGMAEAPGVHHHHHQRGRAQELSAASCTTSSSTVLIT